MNKQDFIKMIPALKECYIIYSNLTRCPYVECDQETFDDVALIYSDVKKAGEKVSSLNEEGKNTVILKVENKGMLAMFTSLFLYDINGVRFHAAKETQLLQLTEIVRRNDISELPEEKRPIENPSLQLSILYFMQEFRAKKENKDMAHIKELEEEMLVNLTRGRYLVPYRPIEQDGQKAQQMMCVVLSDKKPYLPVFTDLIEFRKFCKNQPDMKAAVFRFKGLQTMEYPPEANGIVVNPAGVAAAYPLSLIRRLPSE